MHGKHVKLFNTADISQQLIEVLKDQTVDPKLLKVTPNTIRNFDMGIRMGIAKAHFEHTAKRSESPRDFAIHNLEQFFSLGSNTLLTNTRFRSYRRYFFYIIASYVNEDASKRINEFLRSIRKKEQYALGQQMSKLNSKVRKLYTEGKPIIASTIDNHKDIYDLCSSCVEKYLKILYGIKEASNGTIRDFEDLKNTPIYKIKKKLENSDRNYSLLLKSFSTIIWNADKHTGTIKYPDKKKIEFISNEGKKWKSYSSFIHLTKELCATVFLLSRYLQAILLVALKRSAAVKVYK